MRSADYLNVYLETTATIQYCTVLYCRFKYPQKASNEYDIVPGIVAVLFPELPGLVVQCHQQQVNERQLPET